jgi:hypothetical protein
MAFNWIRMHKYEENIEREINDIVIETVCEYYKVSDTNDLTKEQVNELQTFAEENEYSIFSRGFYYIISEWENYREEEGLDFE